MVKGIKTTIIPGAKYCCDSCVAKISVVLAGLTCKLEFFADTPKSNSYLPVQPYLFGRLCFLLVQIMSK